MVSIERIAVMEVSELKQARVCQKRFFVYGCYRVPNISPSFANIRTCITCFTSEFPYLFSVAFDLSVDFLIALR